MQKLVITLLAFEIQLKIEIYSVLSSLSRHIQLSN